jgi:hypothetical protein
VSPGGSDTEVGTGLERPPRLAVDPSGDVFIADTGNHRVLEVTPYGLQTAIAATHTYTPFGVALDSSGDLYICGTTGGMSAPAPFVGEVPAGSDDLNTLFEGGTMSLRGMAVDAYGELLIADPAQGEIDRLNPLTDQFGPPLGSGLSPPSSVAVEPPSLAVAAAGQSVLMTASVGPPGGANPPTGKVVFKMGSALLGSVPLTGLAATLTTSSLPPGHHTIVASYLGDASHRGSSAVIAVNITP